VEGGGYFTGDFEGQVSYQGMCRIRLWKWVSLSIREPGRDPFPGNFERYLKEGSGNGATVYAGPLLGEPRVGLLYWRP
jgi:hypothetical protein